MERGLSLKYIFRSNGDRVSSQGRRKKDDSCFKNPGGKTSGVSRKPRPLSTEIQRPNNFLGLSRKSFSLRRYRHKPELNGAGSSPPSDWVHDLQLISTSKIHPNIRVEKGRIEFIRPEPDSPSICGNEKGDSVNDHSSSLDSPCEEKGALEVRAVEDSGRDKRSVMVDLPAQFRNRRPKSYSMDHSLDWRGGPDRNLVNEDKIREAVHEHDRCTRRMSNLQEDVRRMEEMVRSMLHYRNQVNDLQLEKSNILKEFENKRVNYENYLKDLKIENESLRSELKQIKEVGCPKALQKRIQILEQENLSLRSDNEELKLQCDRCFDDIAKEIVQTILVHKTLKEECSRLQMKNHMLTEIIQGSVSRATNGPTHRGCSHLRRNINEQRNFKSRLPVPCAKGQSRGAAVNKSRVINCDNLASGDVSPMCRAPTCCVHSGLSQPACCLSPVSLPSPVRPEPCSPILLSSSWTCSAGQCGDSGRDCCKCANPMLTVPDSLSPGGEYPPMCTSSFYNSRVNFPPDVVPPEDVCKSVLWCRQSDAQGNLRAGGGTPPFTSKSGYPPPLTPNFIPMKPQDSVPNNVKDEGYSTMSSDVQLDKSHIGNPSNISVISPQLNSLVPMETVVSKLTVCKQKIQSLNIVIESAEPSPAPQKKYISQVEEMVHDSRGREAVSRAASHSPTPLPAPPNFSGNSEIVRMSRSFENDRSVKFRASSLLKRSLSDSEMFIVKPLCFDKRGVINGLNGNSLPENCASISDVSVDLSPGETHKNVHLPYDQRELEDWTLHEDSKKESYQYPSQTLGSLASIQENSLELEEDSTEYLWTPTYFCDEGDDCEDQLEGQCNTTWDGGDPQGVREEVLVAHSQLSILDGGHQLWPSGGDWESGLYTSKEHLASHPSLQDMLAEADGDFKLKCSGNDSDFRADFYKLVKFGSSKSLCSSLKSIVAPDSDGGGQSHDNSLSELSPPDREIALHSVLKLLAEQRLYFQSLELEDEKVFPSARPTSDKSTEAALFEAEERCSSVSCPSPDSDTGRDLEAPAPASHVISNLQDLLIIEEEDEVVLTPEGELDGGVEEGTMTTWFHFEPDTDLSDPKTRANILDTMVGSSSQSDEESELDEPKPDRSCEQYGHIHRIHRLRRQKKASLRGRQVFRLQANHRQTILDYPDFYVRFGQEEKDAVASFDFLNDLSTSVSDTDCSTELPQDPSECQPSRVRRSASSAQFPATSDGDDTRCLSRSSTVSFNSQNQDVLPEAYLFSDSCAASCYTTSDSSGED